MSSLSIRGSWYTTGTQYVVVLTGMPQDSVRIGLGDTVAEAWSSLETTPIQSIGPDSGEAAALSWAAGAGWLETRECDECDGSGKIDDPCDTESSCEHCQPDGTTCLAVATCSSCHGDGHVVDVESADDEAVASVDSPVGDVDWSDDVEAYVCCCYGTDGDQPGDCYVRVGEDDVGLWWIDDGDVTTRDDLTGPYNTEELAREAAVALAAEQHEGEDGEDAESMISRLLDEAAGEPDPDGEWCVYWETSLDDEGPRDRYATEDAALAAAERDQAQLEAANPGGHLLCWYGVRHLIDGEWTDDSYTPRSGW